MVNKTICPRDIGKKIVIADNTPTVFLWILGAFLLLQIHWGLVVLYLIYIPISVLWFWRYICCYCAHYDSRCCPCGYGTGAAKLFLFRDDSKFKQAFNRNIGIVFMYWIVPLVAGSYLIYYHYSDLILIIFIIALIDAFVVIPAVSKLVGCGSCPIKDECPWMEKSGKKTFSRHI